jgi:hypothetical protein
MLVLLVVQMELKGMGGVWFFLCVWGGSSQGDCCHRGHIRHYLIFPWHWFVSVSRTLETSQFKVAVISCVPLFWYLWTLGNIPFMFYFTLLYVLYVEYLYVVRGGSLTKNMKRGSLFLYCLMFQMFVTVCPSFSISDLISAGLMK